MQRDRRRATAKFSTGSRGGKTVTTSKVETGPNGGRWRIEETRRPGKNGRKGRLLGRKKFYLGAAK